MIEKYLSDDGKFIVSKSDMKLYIRKVGTEELYISAYDMKDLPCEYEETNIGIPIMEEEFDDSIYGQLHPPKGGCLSKG